MFLWSALGNWKIREQFYIQFNGPAEDKKVVERFEDNCKNDRKDEG